MTGRRKPVDQKARYAREKARAAQIGQQLYGTPVTPYRLKKLREQQGFIGAGPVKQEYSALAGWGITAREFQMMRTRNLEYLFPESVLSRNPKHKTSKLRQHQAISANSYDWEFGENDNDWSDDRIGYVVTFFHAIVDPRTNYGSLLDSDGKRRFKKVGRKEYPVSNKWQRLYLTKYGRSVETRSGMRAAYLKHAGIMSVDEFERRYGLYGG